MAHKRMPGLIQRNGTWWIEKMLDGRRIRESTGTSILKEAEKYLIFRLEEIRKTEIYGIRPTRTFEEAAARYIVEKKHLRSIKWVAIQLKRLLPYIGSVSLDKISTETFGKYKEDKKKAGCKTRTINIGLSLAQYVLNRAVKWKENGLTWLEHAPKIDRLEQNDAREPYPLSWEQQDSLFMLLPSYLRKMCLFAVNTGLRDQNVCGLRWEWEIPIPGLNTSIFIIPGKDMKNGRDHIVVLNNVAKSIIESMRGQHPEYVFTLEGNRIYGLNNNAWQSARRKLNLPVRIHDLRHTFGERLRAAGVSNADRHDLLGHTTGDMSDHYSVARLTNLIDAAEKALNRDKDSGDLNVWELKRLSELRRRDYHKIPTQDEGEVVQILGSY